MQPRGGRALAGLLAAVWLWGCGANDVDAPVVPQPQAPCPTLDETLGQTLGAVRDGRLEALASVARELQVVRGGALLGEVVRALVLLLQAIPPELGGALDFAALRGLLDEATPLLAGVLRPFAGLDPADPAERDLLLPFDALGEAIEACPQGSVTNAVQVFLGDAALLEALQVTLRDPTILGLIRTLPAPDGASSSRLGFALLVDTIATALLSQSFVFSELVELIAPFFPTDEPPLRDLLPPLERALSGANLEALRTLITCLRGVERTPSSGEPTSGTLLIGGLLYDLFTDEAVSLIGLLEALDPILTRVADPALLQLLDVVLEAIAGTPELRDNLLHLAAFALDIERVGAVLEGLVVLLEIGGAEEILGLVEALFAPNACVGPQLGLSPAALELVWFGAAVGVAPVSAP